MEHKVIKFVSRAKSEQWQHQIWLDRYRFTTHKMAFFTPIIRALASPSLLLCSSLSSPRVCLSARRQAQ